MAQDVKEIEILLKENLSTSELQFMSPVVLAWIGDSIYSHYVRKYLILNGKLSKINQLNQKSVEYVRAGAQAKAVHVLMRGELTEQEIEIVKHGRNTSSHVPKSASVGEYRYATGFEALLGWLTLQGETERVQKLCSQAIAIVERE